MGSCGSSARTAACGPCNGHTARTSKTVAGDTPEYILDLEAALPVVISGTEAVHLYGRDIIA
jgi:hypothetical protein